jgi:arginyl-tRNA synthetase
MTLFDRYQTKIAAVLDAMAADGELPQGLDTARVVLEAPRDPAHGDLTTNAAMVLAKPASRKPRDIAELLATRLRALPEVEAAEVAGPGFVNLRLANGFWHDCVREILRAGVNYSRSDIGGGIKVNVEYVSANPTGPLTAAHARGAVVGDALAGLLDWAGYDVTREYYINDAGAQVDTLARSVYLRYREALGETIGEIPEGHYPGEYLKEVGQALAQRDGERWKTAPESEWLAPLRQFAIDKLMAEIRDDLAALGIHQEVFTSERALVEAGGVDRVIETLKARDLIYTGVLEPPKGKKPEDWEPRPQLLFRATDFGDEVDRPLQKSDGSWTYFASDIAYHLDKYRRGAAVMIDVWGADHGGYVKRMAAAVKAITEGKAELDVKICQIVHVLQGGKPIRMSKRAGTFVTLRDVIEAVGRDVVRFIMLTRRNDQTLEFDFDKVTEQSKDNPVFYVQYAHARACSVFRNLRDVLPQLNTDDSALADARLELLNDSGELDLIKRLAGWPALVEGAAKSHEPHRLAYYMYDIAANFHTIWTRGRDEPQLRFLIEGNPELTAARLALVRATQIVIATGLTIFGVKPVDEMR